MPLPGSRTGGCSVLDFHYRMGGHPGLAFCLRENRNCHHQYLSRILLGDYYFCRIIWNRSNMRKACGSSSVNKQPVLRESHEPPGNEPAATSVYPSPHQRRHALIGLAALLAQAGFWSNPLSAAMQAPASAPAAGLAPATMLFYTLSQTITGHRDLSAATAARIEQAMRTNVPGFTERLPQLGALLVTGQEAKTLRRPPPPPRGLRELRWPSLPPGHGHCCRNARGHEIHRVAYAPALM